MPIAATQLRTVPNSNDSTGWGARRCCANGALRAAAAPSHAPHTLDRPRAGGVDRHGRSTILFRRRLGYWEEMFDRADQAQFADLGISPAEVERQLRIFTDPPAAIVLDRPCTIGDGIDVFADAERRAALQAHAESAAAGRLMKFVPAS